VRVQPWASTILAETVQTLSLERRLLTFLEESLKQIAKKEEIRL
jgi:hypothetical protein